MVAKLTKGCRGRDGGGILEPLTWVATRLFLLQVTRHLCTQLHVSFGLAEHLWGGKGTA